MFSFVTMDSISCQLGWKRFILRGYQINSGLSTMFRIYQEVGSQACEISSRPASDPWRTQSSTFRWCLVEIEFCFLIQIVSRGQTWSESHKLLLCYCRVLFHSSWPQFYAEVLLEWHSWTSSQGAHQVCAASTKLAKVAPKYHELDLIHPL